jgi:N-acetylglucosamine-6-sulfatase
VVARLVTVLVLVLVQLATALGLSGRVAEAATSRLDCNEADVSYKPRYVRLTPNATCRSHSLRRRYEEAMTVDWVVGRVRRALVAAGRASDTLQILTADNGHDLGDHRLVGKGDPYSTWVPLFMRWPAVPGNSRRVVNEPVSNVDLGKTFCALGGCRFAFSDGESLVPQIRGWSQRIDRPDIYSEMLHRDPTDGQRVRERPAWIQIHSTHGYSDRLWSFTRYQTGEEELDDLTADPHRLQDLAGNGSYAGVRTDPRAFWQEVRDRDGVRWERSLR